MTLDDTDLFLVERNDTNYQVTTSNLMPNLEDTDLMLVARSDTNYKITGLELKQSIGSGAINPGTNDFTFDPEPEYGDGSEENPFMMTPVTISPGGASAESAQTITLIGQDPDADVIWINNSDASTGARFNQASGKTDAEGTYSTKFTFIDQPESTENLIFIGRLQLGLAYFQWNVQVMASTFPPTVNSVNLVINDESGPRFTDQSFTATSSITEGMPDSTKTIDAYVDGTITTIPTTTEIVGVTSDVHDGDWQLAGWDYGGSGNNGPNFFSSCYGMPMTNNNSWSAAYISVGPNTESYKKSYNGKYDGTEWGNYQMQPIQVYTNPFYQVIFAPLSWGGASGTYIAVGYGSNDGDTSNMMMLQGGITGTNWVSVGSTGTGSYSGVWPKRIYTVCASTKSGDLILWGKQVTPGGTGYAPPATGKYAPNLTGEWRDINFSPEQCPIHMVWNGSADNERVQKYVCICEQGAIYTTPSFDTNSDYTKQSSAFDTLTPGQYMTYPKPMAKIAIDENTANMVIVGNAGTDSGGWTDQDHGAGMIVFSTDAETWIEVTPTSDDLKDAWWCDVTHNGEQFIAVASKNSSGGKLSATSTDGQNWTGIETPNDSLYDGNPNKYYGYWCCSSGQINANSPIVTTALPASLNNGAWSLPTSKPLYVDGELVPSANSVYLTFQNNQNIDLFDLGTTVKQNDDQASGILAAKSGNTMTLDNLVNGWVANAGKTAQGEPTVTSNTRRYLDFNSTGTITTLLSAPQDPAYTTSNTNPTLTLTFPSTFVSGQTPDEVLGEGTTMTVSYVASNSAGNSGPLTSTVQPVEAANDNYLNGLTTLYSGTGAVTPIVNGIDLVNYCGTVFLKNRSVGADWAVFDTERGANKMLMCNTMDGETTQSNFLNSFNDDGFTLGAGDGNNQTNTQSYDYASWTFRCQPEFFDVVKYTGPSNDGTPIPHNLGVAPSMMIIKNLTLSRDWIVYQSDVAQGTAPANSSLFFNTNQSVSNPGASYFPTAPDASNFYVATNDPVGDSSYEYIAYLFAGNGDNIKIGTYIGQADPTGDVAVGFKPQFLIIKGCETVTSWQWLDDKRESRGPDLPDQLYPDRNDTAGTTMIVSFTDNGFNTSGSAEVGLEGKKYLYIAIAPPPPIETMTQAQYDTFATTIDEYPLRECVGHLQMEMARTGATVQDIVNYLNDD